jgi:hypothetical protein
MYRSNIVPPSSDFTAVFTKRFDLDGYRVELIERSGT